MIILDTDHISLQQHPSSPEAETLRMRMERSTDRDIVTTSVTVEEQMRSWLALLNRYREVRQQSDYYEQLIAMSRFFNDWCILGFNADSGERFDQHRKAGVRIGPSDLKIACVTIAQGALLLTRNQRDFEKVPGLRFEDWTVTEA